MIGSYANGRWEKGEGRDADARWGVKSGNDAKGRRCAFGYKLHLLVDSHYEVPLAFGVTSANAHDGK